MKIIEKPVNFVKEVKVELGKVAWSSRRELMDSTLVVIGITAMMTLFVGIIDLILSKFLSVLFK